MDNIQGYDLSFLVTQKPAQTQLQKFQKRFSKDQDLLTASETESAEPEKVFTGLDLALKEKQLQNHPEYFEEVLQDLNLVKFWERLNATDRYHVVTALAHERILNFFEAGVGMGMSVKTMRTGGVILALSSTIGLMRGHRRNPEMSTNLAGPMPSLMGASSFWLHKLLDISFDDDQCAVIDSLTRSLARRRPTKATLGSDLLGRTMLDAMKFWPLSHNEELKQFMKSQQSRAEIVQKWPNCDQVFRLVVSIDEQAPPRYTEFQTYQTPWGKTKAFNSDMARVLRENAFF